MKGTLLAGVLCLVFLWTAPGARAEKPQALPDYDYSRTVRFTVSRGGQGRHLWPPLQEQNPPTLGWSAYGFILETVAHFEPIILPPGEHEYLIRLVSPEQMRVLYMGQGWLSDGEKIAFMRNGDYRALEKIFRHSLAQTEPVPDEQLAQLDGGQYADSLAWSDKPVPEAQSIAIAKRRMVEAVPEDERDRLPFPPGNAVSSEAAETPFSGDAGPKQQTASKSKSPKPSPKAKVVDTREPARRLNHQGVSPSNGAQHDEPKPEPAFSDTAVGSTPPPDKGGTRLMVDGAGLLVFVLIGAAIVRRFS